MQDDEAIGFGFVAAWSILEAEPSNEDEYFPPYYPIDESLVTPAIQDATQQHDN